jgi:acyl carrier protein
MTRDAVFAALLPVLRRLCRDKLEAVDQGTLLRDVAGLDSLNLVYAVALLEDQFRVAVDTGALGALRTVGDIVRAIAAGKPVSTATAEAGP